MLIMSQDQDKGRRNNEQVLASSSKKKKKETSAGQTRSRAPHQVNLVLINPTRRLKSTSRKLTFSLAFVEC